MQPRVFYLGLLLGLACLCGRATLGLSLLAAGLDVVAVLGPLRRLRRRRPSHLRLHHASRVHMVTVNFVGLWGRQRTRVREAIASMWTVLQALRVRVRECTRHRYRKKTATCWTVQQHRLFQPHRWASRLFPWFLMLVGQCSPTFVALQLQTRKHAAIAYLRRLPSPR